MSKKTLKLLLVSTLLIIQSCMPGMPGVPVTTLDPNSINTSIAGTSRAALTQTAQSAIPIPPSATPSMTKAPLPSPFPTFTFAVLSTLVRVTANTNCREGPGETYDKVGVLRAGEVAQAVGRSADARYWIIHNPNRPDKLCWLSGKYATLTGVAGALKVFTPPPTRKPTRTNTPKPKATKTPVTPKVPATTAASTSVIPTTAAAPPSFTASYSNMDSCGVTGWWVEIQLTNTGGVPFESIDMSVIDTVTGTAPPSVISDDFINRNGCSGSDPAGTLAPGSAHIVSSSDFTYDPAGHQIEVMLIVCPGPGQSGACLVQGMNFTP